MVIIVVFCYQKPFKNTAAPDCTMVDTLLVLQGIDNCVTNFSRLLVEQMGIEIHSFSGYGEGVSIGTHPIVQGGRVETLGELCLLSLRRPPSKLQPSNCRPPTYIMIKIILKPFFDVDQRPHPITLMWLIITYTCTYIPVLVGRGFVSLVSMYSRTSTSPCLF